MSMRPVFGFLFNFFFIDRLVELPQLNYKLIQIFFILRRISKVFFFALNSSVTK